MTPEDIERELIAFLVDELGLNHDSVSESTTLFTSGVLSSIELIQLMATIDQKYGVLIEFGNMSVDVVDSLTAFDLGDDKGIMAAILSSLPNRFNVRGSLDERLAYRVHSCGERPLEALPIAIGERTDPEVYSR